MGNPNVGKSVVFSRLTGVQVTSSNYAGTTVASTFLAVSFPCVATFAVLFKELGVRDLLMVVGIMMGVALVAGTILNLLWSVI